MVKETPAGFSGEGSEPVSTWQRLPTGGVHIEVEFR